MRNLYATKKQEYLMNIIYNQLGALFEGEINRVTASNYISDNINCIDFEEGRDKFFSYERHFNFPTEKQWNTIYGIEDSLGISFMGNSFDEAVEFISTHFKTKDTPEKEFRREFNCSIPNSYSCETNSFDRAIPSYSARDIEDSLNKAIFFSGGINVYSEDECFDYMF